MSLALAPTSEASLVEQINHEYRQAEHAWRRTAEHAIRCGDLLYQAKLELDYGDWTTWLAENFAGSHRTANQYMQLAEAQRSDPTLLDSTGEESISAAIRLVSRPSKPAKPKRSAPDDDIVDAEVVDERFTLTLEQLADLVRAFGGSADQDSISRWCRRLTEPLVTLCPHCLEPVIRVSVGGTTVTAERYEWQPRGRCTKCLQTRNAHPGRPVECSHCGDTGFTGEARRPPGQMLAIDMAWGDEPHVRVLGERTDRRQGEALHPLHRCAGEMAA